MHVRNACQNNHSSIFRATCKLLKLKTVKLRTRLFIFSVRHSAAARQPSSRTTTPLKRKEKEEASPQVTRYIVSLNKRSRINKSRWHRVFAQPSRCCLFRCRLSFVYPRAPEMDIEVTASRTPTSHQNNKAWLKKLPFGEEKNKTLDPQSDGVVFAERIGVWDFQCTKQRMFFFFLPAGSPAAGSMICNLCAVFAGAELLVGGFD